jgi:hypothetical protein
MSETAKTVLTPLKWDVCITPRKQSATLPMAVSSACYGGAKPTDRHLASKIRCVDHEIIEWLERCERRRRSRQGSREFQN